MVGTEVLYGSTVCMPVAMLGVIGWVRVDSAEGWPSIVTVGKRERKKSEDMVSKGRMQVTVG